MEIRSRTKKERARRARNGGGDRAPLAVVDGSGRGCGPVRTSARTRWRALSLTLVYVVAALHVLHWWLTGSTVTPVEPSEAMQTLGEGLVNAGFVLFALLILSTLIFGRFFCGWGCHIVALQDLCTHLLRAAGIRPRPFRSRLLVWVPLAAALWMFGVPSFVRWWLGRPSPEFRSHFMTEYLWDRFPGPAVAGLTFLVCGFLIVYLLGNKGFCSYGCPYGGIFGLADQVAPGRILVTDACEGCGHCTATCTSNVRVHEEVRVYGMVVHPGCMKCMDCVSVCPKNALHFGFGKPSLFKVERAAPKPAVYDYTWKEEAALGALFLASVIVLLALYDMVPLLLALGAAGISAHVLLTAARTFYVRDLRFARWRLRSAGRSTGAGTGYRMAAAAWVLFLVHSAAVQGLTFAGKRSMQAAFTELARQGATAASDGLFRDGVLALRRAERLGLTVSPDVLARIGAGYSHLGDRGRAEEYYGRAVLAAPSFAAARYELARHLAARGDREQAIAQLAQAVERRPELPGAHEKLASLLLEVGRGSEARDWLERLSERRPGNTDIRLTRGVVLAQTGDVEAGLAETRLVLEREPDHPRALFNLGQILAKQGAFEEALAALERYVEVAPGDSEARMLCAKVASRLERWGIAFAQLDELRRRDPFDPDVVGRWAVAVNELGDVDGAVAEAESAAERDRAARFRLVFLYRLAGREADALRLAGEFAR